VEDRADAEDLLLPQPAVEAFLRRLKVRLLAATSEATNRQLAEALALRLGMTHGGCRLEIELQDGLCTKIRRSDQAPATKLEELAPWPGSEVQPAA
jgi:hypothetical protein